MKTGAIDTFGRVLEVSAQAEGHRLVIPLYQSQGRYYLSLIEVRFREEKWFSQGHTTSKKEEFNLVFKMPIFYLRVSRSHAQLWLLTPVF